MNDSDVCETIHTLIEPINFSLLLKRALPPHWIDLHYDLLGKLKNIKVRIVELPTHSCWSSSIHFFPSPYLNLSLSLYSSHSSNN